MANKAIDMYTHVYPKLVYFTVNSLFAKEFHTKFPILFPLINLLDVGITNYYDVSASLNISLNQLIEHELFRARLTEQKRQDPKIRNPVPPKKRSPFLKEKNKIRVRRGTKMTL